MSEIQLYVDEDAEAKAIVEGLRQQNIDVVTALEANMVGKSDDEQLDYAISQQRAIYILNVSDFAKLHSECLSAGKEHFGFIVIPMRRYSVGEKIRRLADLTTVRHLTR